MDESSNQGGQRMNSAVLIDLKAELFRKREILKQEKLQRESTESLKVPKKKRLPGVVSQIKESQNIVKKVPEHNFEEEHALQKSRDALLQKAKLYEKLNASNAIPEDEDNEKYLVNFQKKIVNRIIEKKYERDDKKDSYEDVILADVPPSDPDEEWVDYTDYLGRSRRCMRKDLAQLMKIDKEFSGSRSSESKYSENNSQKQIQELNVPRSEESKELRAQQCENENESTNASVGPVHYQNVLHKEIRNHGVGYYGFSTEESERADQMKTLIDLREQTVKQREMRERLKQKRKAILEARLDKVRQRKQLKPQEPDNIDKDDFSEDEEEQMEKQASVNNETKEITETVEKPKSVKIRPWDIGKDMAHAVNVVKGKKFTQDTWIQERREERNSEFAPPTFY